jgi:hypothetical protein
LDCTPYLADFLGEVAVFLKPNAGRQLLPEAGATQERTLEGVGCSAWFAWGCPVGCGWAPISFHTFLFPRCTIHDTSHFPYNSLLDHLVRLEEEQRGNGEVKLLGGLQVND